MDPGNWITSIQGGALYSYLLLSVILLSSLIAMLLQAMCAKLGIVTGQDLAQATRARVGPKLAALLWITTELAIMATEIAEVIGSAVALNLLFGIPLMAGVLLTVLDVFLLLVLMKLGFRKIEAFVFVLILTIFLIFAYEVMLSDPDMSAVLRGFIPSEKIFTATLAGQDSALLIGLGIVGATVMPHNLYLHSSIVQSRQYDRRSEAGCARRSALQQLIPISSSGFHLLSTVCCWCSVQRCFSVTIRLTSDVSPSCMTRCRIRVSSAVSPVPRSPHCSRWRCSPPGRTPQSPVH